jgi:hypothetical protein
MYESSAGFVCAVIYESSARVSFSKSKAYRFDLADRLPDRMVALNLLFVLNFPARFLGSFSVLVSLIFPAR